MQQSEEARKLTQEEFEELAAQAAVLKERLVEIQEELQERTRSHATPVFESMAAAYEFVRRREEQERIKDELKNQKRRIEGWISDSALQMADAGLPLDAWYIFRREGEPDVRVMLKKRPHGQDPFLQIEVVKNSD